MNGEYWRSMKDSDFTQFAGSFLEKNRPAASALPEPIRQGLLRVIREKIRTGKEMAEWLDPYLTEDYPYSLEARKKQFSVPDSGKLLQSIEQGLQSIGEDFNDASVELVCKKIAEENQLPKPARVIHLLRCAVSGHTVGPSLFPLLTVLGKTRVVARLHRTRSLWEAGKLRETS